MDALLVVRLSIWYVAAGALHITCKTDCARAQIALSMADADDHRSRSTRNCMFEPSRSAFRSQHSFRTGASVDDDHEALVRAAMDEAEKHPERHRMAVISSHSKKDVSVIDVKKLTTSKKKLVLSRAMETSGQDNERLLTKIRERQDRYLLHCRHKQLYAC